MNYVELLPCSQLLPYVRSFIWMNNQDEFRNPESFRIFTDGNPGLVFQEHQNSFIGNTDQMLPQLFIHGLTTKHAIKTAVSCYSNIVICFQPHGLKSIFGIDACELTDTYINVNAYFRSPLMEKLLEKNSLYDKIRLLSEFLLTRIAENKVDHIKIQFIIKTLSTNHHVSCLKDLCKEMNISKRSLERLMQIYTGASPKQFSRISRFQSALHCLYEIPASRLSDIAYSFNYSDQSHYIREFREFSGFTPKQFLKQQFPLRNFGPDFIS